MTVKYYTPFILFSVVFLRRAGLIEITLDVLETLVTRTGHKYHLELITYNNRNEQILSASFIKASSFSDDDKYAGSRLVLPTHSMSFRSCYSEFKSDDSFHSALESLPTDSSGSMIDNAYKGYLDVIDAIDASQSLDNIPKHSIYNALDSMLKILKNNLSNYQSQMYDLETILVVHSGEPIIFRRKVAEVNAEMCKLKEYTASVFNYFDKYMLTLYRYLHMLRKSKFDSVTKQYDTSTDTDKIKLSWRAISYLEELISILNTSHSYYMCSSDYFKSTSLCKFIEYQTKKALRKRDKTVAKHKRIINECEQRMERETSREEESVRHDTQERSEASRPRTRHRGGLSAFSSMHSRFASVRKKRK